MKKIVMIGSGPSSMMAAVKLVDNGYTNITIIEKGDYRLNQPSQNLTNGWAGAGSFSDSKINMTHKVGGTLHELIGMNDYYKYLKEQEELWLRFKPNAEQNAQRLEHKPNADLESRYFTPNANVGELRAKALNYHLDLDTYTILHVGTDNMYDICANIYKYLIEKGVEIILNADVYNIWKENNKFFINYTLVDIGEDCFETVESDIVLVATGRSGGNFIKSVAKNFELEVKNNGVDIGVRVEMPEEIGYPLKQYGIYEPKFWGYKGRWQSKVRTFCYCPENAFVAMEEYRDTGIQCVNGHSYSSDGASSGNLNFSILATTVFTEPCNNAMGYIENIAKQVNIAGDGGPLVQRFGDLKQGKRSTMKKIAQGATIPSLDCYAGDLGLVMPARQLDAIIEFLDDLGKVIPGMNTDYALLYAPEVKFYSNKIALDVNSMSQIDNLYFAGDGSGHTRGLNQASIQGLVFADAILKKYYK